MYDPTSEGWKTKSKEMICEVTVLLMLQRITAWVDKLLLRYTRTGMIDLVSAPGPANIPKELCGPITTSEALQLYRKTL